MYTFSQLRKDAGYSTQEALAEALDLKSRAVIARWEIGASYPRTQTIPKVAKILNTTEGEVIASINASKKSSA